MASLTPGGEGVDWWRAPCPGAPGAQVLQTKRLCPGAFSRTLCQVRDSWVLSGARAWTAPARASADVEREGVGP